MPEPTSPDVPVPRTARLQPRPALRLAALLATAGMCVTHPAAAEQLPALLTTPSHEHHVGKVVFAELVTPDLKASERFYTAMFGWTFQEAPGGPIPFAQASIDGRAIAGIFQRPAPPGRYPAWIGLVATGDVGKTVDAATRNGGKVLLAPHQFANLGSGAVLSDPQGAVFAVLASSSGDPQDLLADRGEWIWNSLVASDPDADAAFYRAVFGYDAYPMTDSPDGRHLILASGDFARASVNPIPATWHNTHPRWLSYVRVDDAAAAAAKATSLGGHVVLPARMDRHGGRIAVIADPAGAVFGLLEWSEAGPAGAAK